MTVNGWLQVADKETSQMAVNGWLQVAANGWLQVAANRLMLASH